MTDPFIRSEIRTAARKRRLGPDAACSACGGSENLRRQAGGEFLCYVCRRIRGGATPVERHHLAGRANLGGVLIDLRANDHATVTEIGLRLGTDLWPAAGDDPLLQLAHLLAGLAALLVLVAEWLLAHAGALAGGPVRPFPVVA